MRAIFANKMRSVLTVLGVMIGVAAVIAVVSLVQGMQHKLASDLQDIGTTFIEVFPTPPDQRTGFLQKTPDLTVEDAEAVRRGTLAIRDFTPLFLTSAQLRSGDYRHGTQMYAVNSSYQEIVNHWVEHGRFFTPLDEEQRKRVVVVGRDVIRDLHLGDEPFGKTIDINANTFTVIGTFEKKGGSFGNNQDDIVVIPFATATVLYGNENMRKLILAFQMRDGADMDYAKDQVTDVLRARHGIKEGQPSDFRILAQEEIMKKISSALLTTTLILAAVVGIALLVGGIGIMNIMLVSVTERTREIGVRKSIGARRRDIMIQFLIEAIALSGFGGGVGIVSGFILANVVRAFLTRWTDFPPVHTPLWAIVLAVSFCCFLGILFGMYPAAKASKLDPIEALRYE